MNAHQSAIFLRTLGALVRAQAKIAGMQAYNQNEVTEMTPPYTERDFENVIIAESVGINDIELVARDMLEAG